MLSIPRRKIVHRCQNNELTSTIISADALRNSQDSPAAPETPRLRSGLYLLRSLDITGELGKLYVLYWPQSSTWNDNAESSVRRNRVTFMR
jgi:hypothetical protein